MAELLIPDLVRLKGYMHLNICKKNQSKCQTNINEESVFLHPT